uniref:Uncharacterized protein n=1 Tax=Anguilla anguilla TaxID=7936 RepID=A0A0E9PC46_ANGAN
MGDFFFSFINGKMKLTVRQKRRLSCLQVSEGI